VLPSVQFSVPAAAEMLSDVAIVWNGLIV
jgi:hypothetical protein